MLRLRRSDFLIWDYYKRGRWKRIKRAIKAGDEETIAWAMKRANGRGLHVIAYRSPWLAWMIAIGIVAIEAERPMGHHARLTIRRLKRVIKPEDKKWLETIAASYSSAVKRRDEGN